MPDAKREALIEKMTDASYDGGMAAALAVALPIIRKDALISAAAVVCGPKEDEAWSRDMRLAGFIISERLHKLSEAE